MLRKVVTAGALLILTGTASAQLPVTDAGASTRASKADAGTGSGGVPTYWVMMVTGEKDGAPWIKTTTPETMGGSVKGTGSWSCSYPATRRGADADGGYEEMEVACGVGDAEVFTSLRCNFRSKAKPGKLPGKGWKRSELQTLNLRRKGDTKSTVTVSLRCDVDAAFTKD